MKSRGAGRIWPWMAVSALLAVLPACGRDDGDGMTPSTLAPEPTRTQIAGGTFNVVGTPEANRNGFLVDIAAGPVPVPGAGTLEIVADWTFASNDLDILLYSGSCNALQAARGECPIVSRTTGATTKPERLSMGVPAGNYSVGFANFGLTADSGNFQVFLTR